MPCQASGHIAASPQTSTRPARVPGCPLAGTAALDGFEAGLDRNDLLGPADADLFRDTSSFLAHLDP